MKISKFLTTVSAIAISVGASQAPAQEVKPEIFKVAKEKSQKIDRHGFCRVV